MSKSRQRAGAVVENRVAPPQLEAVAGWDATDEAAYNAAATGDVAVEGAPSAPVPSPPFPACSDAGQDADYLTRRRGGAEETSLTPQASPLTACMCQSFLGNLGPTSGGYHTRHVDVGGLSAVEQEVLARLRAGLIASHATIRKKGHRTKHVESSADTIRWLLQQLAGLSIANAG